MKAFQQYAFPVLILSVLCLLLVPLPAIVLDFFLITNLGVAILVLFLSTSIGKPSDFSVFPSLLLVLTLGRLSLNVASTRMILTKGAAFDSILINTFGHWVIGGNYVVGAVIFLILVVIQFMVITKGAERVAEVSARFTLESLPMKQMSIDSSLSAGHIDKDEAAEKRAQLEGQADFYGAMDGASKFIKNESLASLFIVGINITGGISSGLLAGGFSSIGELFKTYVLLTIGDGLVGLIPSLLVSTAAGFIITRTSSEGDLSADLASQLGSHSDVMAKSLWLLAVLMVLFGVFAGVAPVPFLLIGGLFGYAGYLAHISPDTVVRSGASGDGDDESVVVRGKVNQVELFISHQLWERWSNDSTLDHLRALSAHICKKVYDKRGIPISPIELSSTDEFDICEYALFLRGDLVLSSTVDVDGIMAVAPLGEKVNLKGTLTRAPSGRGRARWISQEDVEKAHNLGYKVLNASDIISDKVYSAIVAHGDELLGFQEMDEIWNSLAHHFPAVAAGIEEANIDRVFLLAVIKGLVEEGVSIRNSCKIFEAIVNGCRVTKDIDRVIDIVRCDLSRQISREMADSNDVITVITVHPATEEEIRDSLYEATDGVVSPALPPDRAESFLRQLSELVSVQLSRGIPPTLMVPADLRRMMYLFCSPRIDGLTVISFSEVHSAYSVNFSGEVCLAEPGESTVHTIGDMASHTDGDEA